MKQLVALTCLAVLAAVGYFFWDEYQAAAAKSAAEDRAMRRAEAAMCSKMIKELQSGKTTEDWRGLHLKMCVEKGHLSEGDFSDPTTKHLYEHARSMIDRTP